MNHDDTTSTMYPRQLSFVVAIVNVVIARPARCSRRDRDMAIDVTMNHPVVSHDEWLAARRVLLEQEKAFTLVPKG